MIEIPNDICIALQCLPEMLNRQKIERIDTEDNSILHNNADAVRPRQPEVPVIHKWLAHDTTWHAVGFIRRIMDVLSVRLPINGSFDCPVMMKWDSI